MENNYQYFSCQYFIPREQRGRRGNVLSFPIANVSIHAFNTSLEALVATYYMLGGCKGEHFTHKKQLPICQFSFYRSGEGDDATSPSFVLCTR